MIEYRDVLPSDAEEITKIYLDNYWQYLNLNKLDPNPDIDLETIIGLHDAGILLGIVGIDDGIKSAYIALKSPYMFQKNVYASQDVLWFLHPSVRKDKEVLERFMEEIIALNKQHEIDIIALHMPYLGKKERESVGLLNKGFFKQEVTYLKNLRN